MSSTILNSDRIKLGSRAIQLLRSKDVTVQTFRDQMWQFMRDEKLERLIKEDFSHSLEQNVAGLCYWQEVTPGILWVDRPRKKFYLVPDALRGMYEEGVFHNGVWCDNISRVRTDLLTQTIIDQISKCHGDADSIREIVNPLKEISQREPDPMEYQVLAWKAE